MFENDKLVYYEFEKYLFKTIFQTRNSTPPPSSLKKIQTYIQNRNI